MKKISGLVKYYDEIRCVDIEQHQSEEWHIYLSGEYLDAAELDEFIEDCDDKIYESLDQFKSDQYKFISDMMSASDENR